MSFSNFNNNIPQGSQLQDCSSGSPIGGIDNNNIFRLLHLTSGGGLTNQSIVPAANTYYSVSNPLAGSSGVAGLKGAGIILAYADITPIALSAGVYDIRPVFIQDQNSGGAVNIVLVKTSSQLDAYISTRIIGSDAFAPSIADYLSGCAAVWHNLVMQDIGTGSTSFALNTTNNADIMTQSTYLAAGSYKLMVFVHTAITTGPTSTNYTGVQFFNQIA